MDKAGYDWETGKRVQKGTRCAEAVTNTLGMPRPDPTKLETRSGQNGHGGGGRRFMTQWRKEEEETRQKRRTAD